MKMRISGTGSALPAEAVDNNMLAKWVDTSDEWIRERTGIGKRRVSTGETVVSLAAEACEKALAQAGKTAKEVDMILLATCSPEYLLPCCACQVQAQIGADNAVAFDINSACSGFLFGLITANAYIQSGMYRNILVVGSEVLSKIIDWEDRSSCILFGDGAGAVLVEAVDENCGQGGMMPEASRESSGETFAEMCGMIGCVQGSDGSKGMVLKCRERMTVNPLYREDEAAGDGDADKTVVEGMNKAAAGEVTGAALKKPQNLFVQMDGREVFRFAVRQVPECINQVLQKTGLTLEDIDLFILHQANERIIEGVVKRLGADKEKFPMNLAEVGNMSSASIPVLLDELNRAGRIHRGDKLVLSGFGAGLTYGACILVW